MKEKLKNTFSMMYYEWLKLQKHKLTWFYMLILLLLPFFAIKLAYDDTIFTVGQNEEYPSNKVTNIETGEHLVGFDSMRYLDTALHAQQGISDLNYASYVDIQKTIERKAEKYLTVDNLDPEIMTRYYGKDWLTLLEKSNNGTLRQIDIEEANEYPRYGGYSYSEEELQEIVVLNPHYNANTQRMLDTLQILNDHQSVPPLEVRKLKLLSVENQAASVQEHIVSNQLLTNSDEEPKNTVPPFLTLKNVDQTMIDYLNNQYLNASETFDSQIGINFFVLILDNMAKVSPFVFLLFAFIFAPLFNQEYTNKTDQILKPTKLGLSSQAHAKISLCVGIIFLYGVASLLLFWLVPLCIIGYHDLDIVFRFNDVRRAYFYNPFKVSALTFSLNMASLYLLSYLILASIIAGLSSIAKNTFAFLIAFLPLLALGYLGLLAPILNEAAYGINYVSPMTFYDLEFIFQIVELLNFNYHSIGGFIISNSTLMWCVWGILCMIFILIAKTWYRKKTVNNA